MNSLPRAWGAPPVRARLRQQPEDFEVEEILGFEPSGNGEHAFLWVEKAGVNTEWLARRLAAFAGVPPADVGFAGLKDRHALTRQWFSLQLAGREDPAWETLSTPGVRVLSSARHSRKLRRGTLRGNRFRIRLRELAGQVDALPERLASIAGQGVPNYFGEQRFGRERGNLELARALFAGRRLPRTERGFALSAARAEIFNALLARRVLDGSWRLGLDGEVWMLDGSHSIFGPEPLSAELAQRVAAGDVHPTGPLWGRGALRPDGAAERLERAVADQHAALAQGLEAVGLEQERRALRLPVGALQWQLESQNALRLEFQLGAGSFATAVLHEICDAVD